MIETPPYGGMKREARAQPLNGTGQLTQAHSSGPSAAVSIPLCMLERAARTWSIYGERQNRTYENWMIGTSARHSRPVPSRSVSPRFPHNQLTLHHTAILTSRTIFDRDIGGIHVPPSPRPPPPNPAMSASVNW